MTNWDSISTIVSDVQSKKTSALENVEKALKLIDEKQDFNAIISIPRDLALKRAKDIDDRIKSGEKVGRLAGVPFIAKDNFLTFGSETTAASNMLKGFKAPYQSTAINRLESEGAICVAKANLDAFAHGSSTENSDYMVTKNPHDKERVPGGSSGGSAAAVVLGMAPFALGTDTGGSIRLPASFCGAVGYKPTYGLISRSGVVAMASSTDVIGPLTNSVEDAQLVVACMSGLDELDATTTESEIPEKAVKIDLKGKKVGLIKEFAGDGVQREVKDELKRAIDELVKNGAEIVDITLPSQSLALACYYVLVPAEISSNLSRYDGQRFEHTAKDAKSLQESYLQARTEGFGKEAKRRIMIGTYVLSSGYYDAYYKQAQLIRTKIIKEYEEVFNEVDFMISPVAPMTAFKIGENANDPLQMYLADAMTVGVSLAGLPAISIPSRASSKDLPVGIQLITKFKNDVELLSLAHTLEGALS